MTLEEKIKNEELRQRAIAVGLCPECGEPQKRLHYNNNPQCMITHFTCSVNENHYKVENVCEDDD
jgi:hypothetical protein